MSKEFRPSILDLKDTDHDRYVLDQLVLFLENDTLTAISLIKAAQAIGDELATLPETDGKRGFVLAIAENKKGAPIATFQIGEITEDDPLYKPDGKLGKYAIFARKKIEVIQRNPRFISSSQNTDLDEENIVRSPVGQIIPGGAVVVRNLIISVSAFKDPNMDTLAALAIPVAAHIIPLEEAERIAKDPRVNCQEFLDHWAKKALHWPTDFDHIASSK